MQDEQIILDIKNGNREAFGLLAEKYKDALYSFIFYSVKDEGAAGDIFQDTLLKAMTQIDKYKEEGKFKPWLFTIARNKITDHYRKNAKFIQFGEEEDGDKFAHARDNTEALACGAITLEEIGKFLCRLPREQQEVILMRTHLSFKEIAAALGCPIGTVLARMNRGIKKLQQYMGEEYAS